MAKPKVEEVKHGEPAAGYALSALVFAGFAALWAFVVRDDPFYHATQVFGVRAPVMMLVYLVGAPLVGFVIGLWRYDRRHHGGVFSFAGKLIARGVHFTYAHFLLVLFTIAMATDYFLGLNLDAQVKAIDDRAFDVAARFAPWLAAYLAGFNIGRAIRIARDYAALAAALPAGGSASFASDAPAIAADGNPESRKKARKEKSGRRDKKLRAEPALTVGALDDQAAQGDSPQPAPALTSSGLPQPAASAPPEEPGFLPPQDFSALRPSLRELR